GRQDACPTPPAYESPLVLSQSRSRKPNSPAPSRVSEWAGTAVAGLEFCFQAAAHLSFRFLGCQLREEVVQEDRRQTFLGSTTRIGLSQASPPAGVLGQLHSAQLGDGFLKPAMASVQLLAQPIERGVVLLAARGFPCTLLCLSFSACQSGDLGLG